MTHIAPGLPEVSPHVTYNVAIARHPGQARGYMDHGNGVAPDGGVPLPARMYSARWAA